MISLRLRLNLIAFASIGAAAWSGWNARVTFVDWQRGQIEAEDRFNLRTTLENLRSSPLQGAGQTSLSRAEQIRELQKIRANLAPKDRQEHLSDIIQAYSASDSQLLTKRIVSFQEAEVKAFKELNIQLISDRELWVKYIVLAALAPILGLLILILTIRSRVFKSIDRLSRRMKDFLIDRYSFQFSTPEMNELGDLQRTFNSLAQRVINNMDDLKSLDQAKSEFLSIASHELRTPMTSIKGSLGVLSTGVIGQIDPACMKLIKIAEIETDRLIRLINDLLDLAKIEAGRLPLACAWSSWNEAMSITSEGLMGLAHKADVKIDLQPLPGLEIYIDRDRIQQVVTNLVSNAIKFSPKGGTVWIAASRTQNGELLVSIRDQGPGIELADQELIFQKFRQGAKAENPIVKGTGLGLAIAKALVAEHGGDIGVESQPSQGSIFWFTLPKWRDDEASSEEIDADDERRAA